jgi:recombination protein RecT
MTAALATLSERHKVVSVELNKARERIAQVIPAGTGLMPTRAIAVVLDAMSRNPDLLECTPRSIVRTVCAAAEVGLELGSPLGEAFMVPFKNHKKHMTEATMIIGYRGFVRLIRGGPNVTIVKSVLVRERDDFEVDEGNNKLTHILPKGMSERQRGDIVFAYSRVYYASGQSQFDVMDRDSLDKLRRSSKDTRPSAPWNSHPDEMYKKCPLRRMAKWLDLSQLARRASELDVFESQVRGEMPGIQRDGFDSGRNQELKDMLGAQASGDADVIEAEIEE